MYFIIILLFILPSIGQSEDVEKCLDESINMTLAFKAKELVQAGAQKVLDLQKARNEKIKGSPAWEDRSGVDPEDICKNIHPTLIKTFNEKKKQLQTSKSIVSKAIKKNRYVSKTFVDDVFFWGESESSTKNKYNASETCEKIKRFVNKTDFLDPPSACELKTQNEFIGKIKSFDYTNKSFHEICMYTILNQRKYYKASSQCHDIDEKETSKKTSANKEPPGEEIPADVPTPKAEAKRTLPAEDKIPIPTQQPGRTRTGSGATRQ